MARKRARKGRKAGKRKSSKRKTSKRTSSRRKTSSARRGRGKGKVPLPLLEKRLKKLNSIVKTRKGKAYHCGV